MKVYLIQPPSKFLVRDKFLPTWGLLMMREYFRKVGYDVEIVEVEDKPEEIPLYGDFYGISMTTPHYGEAKNIYDYLHQNTNTQIIIGGPHPSTLPEQTQDEFPEAEVIPGEGEWQFFHRVHPNVRPPDNEILSLDRFPFPRISDEEMEYYGQYKEMKAINLITSRGCPYNCAFCANNVIWGGRKVRYHSIEYMKDALDYCKHRGFETIRVCDESFVGNKMRLEILAKHMYDLGLKWECQARPDQLDSEVIDLMVGYGCREVAIGIESGSDEILQLNNKKITVAQNIKCLHSCKKAGLQVRAYILLGLPGETEETLLKTEELMEMFPSIKFTISVFTPFPGCDITNHPERFGVTIEDAPWSAYVGIGKDIVPETLLKEMKPLQSKFVQLAEKFVNRSTYGKHLKLLERK